jgi:hypothetical protein
MQSLTIGEVAKAAEVAIEAVRFYEREGLIAEPPRRQSGYRQYPPIRYVRSGSSDGQRSARPGGRIQAALTELVRTCEGRYALDEKEDGRGDR